MRNRLTEPIGDICKEGEVNYFSTQFLASSSVFNGIRKDVVTPCIMKVTFQSLLLTV